MSSCKKMSSSENIKFITICEFDGGVYPVSNERIRLRMTLRHNPDNYKAYLERSTNLKMRALQQEILNVVLRIESHTPMPPDDLVDTVDLSLLFKITKKTVSRWRQDGLIESVKIGRKHFYSKKKVLEMKGRNEF